MPERSLAGELSMLATEVDSLAKALVRAQTELAGERKHRREVESEAEELSQQLRQARRRAKAAERELVKVTASADKAAHQAKVTERELKVQLEQEQQTNQVLRHEVARTETERLALEVNLREVLGNLRHAAETAGRPRVTVPPAT